MKRVQVSIPVPDCVLSVAASVAPVARLVRRHAVAGWIAARTWGMHPSAPYHSDYARLRAKSHGGVRL